MQKANPKKPLRKPQSQKKPGLEFKMTPPPQFNKPQMRSGLKLNNKIAFITGGDSGIGRAVSVLFAKEGADIAIVYLTENKDADDTKKFIEKEFGRKCLLIAGDISKEKFCNNAVAKAVKQFGRIDILVNNAATHFESKTLADIFNKTINNHF
jgi:NAD(P)-dependent dehydrogenase (short-subunit alcohol dehydrogenase family)